MSANRILALVLSAAAMIAAIGVAWLHPVWPGVQVGMVVAFAGLGLWRPWWFFAVFSAALVMADAYPWTGQLVVREYDSILLGNLAGCLAACAVEREVQLVGPNIRGNRLAAFAWMLLGVSVLLAFVRGWISLPAAPWDDQLSVYFTRWNAVRQAKGFVWAIVFGVVCRCLTTSSVVSDGVSRSPDDSSSPPPPIFDYFAVGATIALVYVCLGVVWERMVYVGLFDFSEVHRASGPIWTMHIGGQHIDALLVIAFPLAWYTLVGNTASKFQVADSSTKSTRGIDRVLRLGFTVGFFLVVVYATFATMSRATIVIVGAEALWMAGVQWHGKRRGSEGGNRGRSYSTVMSVGLLVCLAGLATYQIPNAIRSRFENTAQDSRTRLAHWTRIAKHVVSDPRRLLFGSGFGTTPTFLAMDDGRTIPPASLQQQNGQLSLRLSGGWPMYVETMIPAGNEVAVDGNLVRERQDEGEPTRLAVIRSVKSMFQSYEKASKTFDVTAESAEMNIRVPDPREIVPPKEAAPTLANLRLQTLAFYNPGPQSVVVNDLTIAIGGGDKHVPTLFFTCDDHLAWRTKNALLQLWHCQGMLGAAAVVLLAFACWPGRDMPGRGAVGTTLGCILIGIVAIGSVGSLFDAAWITAVAVGCIGASGR
ncbi:hypothetical protein [Stieleria neptunia]|nr:hypothetical protein [Stieleria neptunia]